LANKEFLSMDVEIVSIGDEVLSGLTVNGNAAFLSRELSERGYSVRRHTTLPDEIEKVRVCLQDAMHRSSFVIATGGLGPTLDDLTREAAATLFNEKPLELKNHLGTAPGVFGDNLVLLPGVPREMERMFLEEALPLLEERFPLDKRYYVRRCTLSLLRELEVDPFLRKLQAPGLEIGIYPSYGSLQIVFRSLHPVDEQIRKMKEEFPTFYVGEGKIEDAVHREMIAKKKRLGIAESCTGGALAARLVSVPDASLFFSGSIVAYSNEWKERFLGVRHDTLSSYGAVSIETVEEMIQGLFDETECDFALAVSGTLGPKGGTAEKPVGTVYIAVAKRKEFIDVGRLSAPQDRKAGIEFTVQTALGALWRRIAHNTATFS
jgi:nicotinamide-nucleotide amidase